MAANMDALLKITTQVDGTNNIVALNRGLQSVEGTAKGVTTAMRGMTGAAAGLSGALGALAPLLSVAGLVGLAKGALEAGEAVASVYFNCALGSHLFLTYVRLWVVCGWCGCVCV